MLSATPSTFAASNIHQRCSPQSSLPYSTSALPPTSNPSGLDLRNTTTTPSRPSHSTTRTRSSPCLPRLPPHTLTAVCVIVARLLHLLFILSVLARLEFAVRRLLLEFADLGAHRRACDGFRRLGLELSWREGEREVWKWYGWIGVEQRTRGFFWRG